MLKNVLFLLKNCKNRQTLRALPPDPLASGGWRIRPRPPSVILHWKFFSLHLDTRSNSFGIDQKVLYVLVIIAGVHQAFGKEKIMLHFLC